MYSPNCQREREQPQSRGDYSKGGHLISQNETTKKNTAATKCEWLVHWMCDVSPTRPGHWRMTCCWCRQRYKDYLSLYFIGRRAGMVQVDVPRPSGKTRDLMQGLGWRWAERGLGCRLPPAGEAGPWVPRQPGAWSPEAPALRLYRTGLHCLLYSLNGQVVAYIPT